MPDETKQDSNSKYALLVRRAAQLPAESWPDERIATVARTVAPPEATSTEVAMFLAVAHRYGLDPFAKEIWLAKDHGRLIILTGKDSILKVARRDPGYSGHVSGAVYEKDTFKVVREGDRVDMQHEQGLPRGKLLGAYSVARKEGHPDQVIMREIGDYAHLVQKKDNWKQYTEDMIVSRVVTAAHRLLYNISGMYTQEEVDSGDVDAPDLASHEVAKKSQDRMQQLRSTLEQDGEDLDAIPEAEAEIVGQDAEEPAEDPPEDPSDFQREKGRYFALWNEVYRTRLLNLSTQQDRQEFRRGWQEEHVGKGSAGNFSTDDFRKASAMLEEGIGLEADGEAPAEPETVKTGASQDGDSPFEADDDLPF